jgi:hypothetical protein
MANPNGTGGFRAPDTLDAPGSIRLTEVGPGVKRKAWIVRPGDTYSRIAARRDVYNDASKWKRIAEANGQRGVKISKKLIGKEIRIPNPGRSGTTVDAYLTGAVVVTAGYGGWSRVARPRRIALTEWVGRDAMSMELPLMFNTFGEAELDEPGMITERNIRALERLAGIDETDPEPPLFEIFSTPAKLVPHNEARAGHIGWFIQDLSWDASSIIINSAGNRERAACTVTITQFVSDERLAKTSAAKARAKAKKKSKGKKKAKKK